MALREIRIMGDEVLTKNADRWINDTETAHTD